MIRLVELALYGIRQFQSMTRIPFGPGFNLITGGTGTGKSTIWELLDILLFPLTTPHLRPFIHPHHGERAQAALIFQTDDGTRYRLVKDFVSNRISLAKLDADGQPAPIVAQDGPSVESKLNELRHGLSSSKLHDHWLLSHMALPSMANGTSNGRVATTPTTASSPPTTGRTAAVASGDAAKLAELEAKVAHAEQTIALEEKMMAAQDRAIAIKQKVTSASQYADDLAAAKADAERCAGFAELPDDYPVLMEGLVEREHALQSQLNTFAEEFDGLEADRAMVPSGPIFRQRWFLVGAGLMVAGILFALFVTLPKWYGSAIFSGLLVPGIGLLVWTIVTDMRTQQKRSTIDARMKALKVERDVIEKRFRREQKPALDILVHTQCEDVSAFQERLRNYSRLREETQRLVEEQERAMNGQTFEQLTQAHQDAENESRKLERELRDLCASGGVLPGDLPALQTEIARMKSGTSPQQDAPTADAPVVENGRELVATSWIEQLRALWPHDHPGLQSTVSMLFGKLNGGSYAKIEWADNQLRLLTHEQQSVDPDLLSSGQRDLLRLACFLAPWLYSRREPIDLVTIGQFPLLLDDPLVSLDSTGQAACIQLLRSIATVQQVLLVTRLPIAEHQSDHRITLPTTPVAKEASGR